MILAIMAIGIMFMVLSHPISDGESDSYNTSSRDGWAIASLVVGMVIVLASLITVLVLGIQVSKLKVIDRQIEMYTQENQYIELQIDVVVKTYMDWEKETYGQFGNESSIILVQLFPELKTSELINKQVEVYLKNNNTIRELKSKQINGTVTRWWLYFGS